MDHDPDDSPTISGVSPRKLRMAAAAERMDARTALRALSGLPVRNHGRERLLAALVALGADVSNVPEPLLTGKVDLDDVHGSRR
jgi:hypothetical protein